MTVVSVHTADAATQLTRSDLADYLGETFAALPTVDRSDLLRTLEAHQAPADVVDLVAARVPEGVRLQHLRSLWTYLGDLPVSR